MDSTGRAGGDLNPCTRYRLLTQPLPIEDRLRLSRSLLAVCVRHLASAIALGGAEASSAVRLRHSAA